MRNYTTPCVLALILLFSWTATASALSCPRSNPEVKVKRITYKTKYYRGTSAWYLTAWTGHWGKGVVLGLHSGAGGNSPFWADYNIEVAIDDSKNGPGSPACMTVKKITMRFFIQPVVHIASEYPKGTCEFKEILKHEKKHVKVTKDWQKKYAPLFERELGSISKKIPAFAPISSAAMVEQRKIEAQNLISAHLFTYAQKHALPEFIRLQNKVDDPLEYRLVPTRCENWNDYHVTAYQPPEMEKAQKDDGEGESDSEGSDESGGGSSDSGAELVSEEGE